MVLVIEDVGFYQSAILLRIRTVRSLTLVNLNLLWVIGLFMHLPLMTTTLLLYSSRVRNYNEQYVHFCVFSMRTGIWKRYCHLDDYYDVYKNFSCKTTVMNDIMYWHPGCLGHEWEDKRICAFDLVNEEWKEYPWLDFLNEYFGADFFVRNGCLSLYCHKSHMVDDVWTLKHYDDRNSWEFLFSVNFGDWRFYTSIPTGKILVRSLWLFKIFDVSNDRPEQGDARSLDYTLDIRAESFVETLTSPFGTINFSKDDNEV